MGTVYLATVLAETVSFRNGPGYNYSVVDDNAAHKGTTFFISETSVEGNRTWGKTNNGWVLMTYGKDRYIDYHPYERPRRLSRSANNDIVAYADDGGANSSNTTTTGSTTTVEPATTETVNGILGTMKSYIKGSDELEKRNMRLFGIPYQFRPAIDVRQDNISKKIGRKFIENIVNEAPVVTIIPGKPKYLPGVKNKTGWTHAFMQAASGNFAELQQLTADEDGTNVRYYDFQQSYTEYMKYVNIFCRTAATFLELNQTLDGTPLQSYDWRNYRWTGDNYKSVAGKLLASASNNIKNGMVELLSTFGKSAKDVFNKVMNSDGSGNNSYLMRYSTTSSTDEEDATMESLLQTANFLQFYCDPDMGTSEGGSNNVGESKIKGMLDTGSDAMKELAFITSSGGVSSEGLQDITGSGLNALSDHITSSSGAGVTEFLKRILDTSGSVLKGENVIMPQIYNSSDYERRKSLTVHLKAPYGNKYAYYMDVLVPMFHLLCLALPKQTTANTYGAPFLIKAYCEGVFTCNLGIVTGISINKTVSPESWTNDGFPSEVDVTLDIVDLYSDLTMSPQNSPALFLSNSSLIEYLATTCGLNLLQPQLSTKMSYIIQTVKNSITDIPHNIISEVTDKIENIVANWTQIS